MYACAYVCVYYTIPRCMCILYDTKMYVYIIRYRDVYYVYICIYVCIHKYINTYIYIICICIYT